MNQNYVATFVFPMEERWNEIMYAELFHLFFDHPDLQKNDESDKGTMELLVMALKGDKRKQKHCKKYSISQVCVRGTDISDLNMLIVPNMRGLTGLGGDVAPVGGVASTPPTQTAAAREVLWFDAGRMPGMHKSWSLTHPCHNWAEERKI